MTKVVFVVEFDVPEAAAPDAIQDLGRELYARLKDANLVIEPSITRGPVRVAVRDSADAVLAIFA